MPVDILGDPARLLEPSEFGYVVAAVPDYVPAIQRIKRAVANKEPLRILVHDATCAVWLERFAGSYSDAVVHYATKTARDLLAQRWQTEIPDRITDQAILASGFLEANIVPRSGQLYDEIVLEHYWGEFFTFVRFPLRLAGELIDSLDLARWKANQGRPLAMQALQACKDRWLSQTTQRELKKLVRAVFETPGVLRDSLGCYKLLQRYPAQLGQAVLEDWYTLFKNLEIDPTPVDLDGINLGDAVQEVQYYLNNLSTHIRGQADLESVLDEMSGWLPEELEWVVEQLRDKSETLQPTPQLLQHIEARFRPIQDQTETQLAALEAAIPPDYPSDPAENQTVEEWLHWAVQEYLPYRFWLEENDHWDNTVAEYAASYADWFYENYTEHKYQDQDRWVFSLLNHAMQDFKEGRKVLFVVIDNFNFKYLRPLISQFNRRGFRVVGQVEPKWAPVPTTTEVSKWCLVAGETELQKVQGRSYEDILDKDWRGLFEGRQVTYLSRLGDLKKRRRFREDLVLLNYLPIDTVLHKDERQIGTTHTAEVRGYIETLVEVVCQFAKRARVEQDFVIYIASDHGSTKIPPDVGIALDDKLYRKQAQDRHHRYITVPKKRAANPTAYDEAHCYIIRADAFGTHDHYFVAKDYDRFIETKESIYVHGGLTPEETIVPFCKLVRAEIEALQPSIRLPDNVIRYSVKANLVFVVSNPNDYDITNVELNVVESDLPGAFIEAIPAGIATEITIPVRIKRRPGVPTLEAITVEGSFELQGQRFAIRPMRIPVEARSLVESKAEFDFGV
ncbi:MAG: hypothetical protein H8E47_02760 [Anaerolineales bacterium]|nr:hypothetical protein [Anaerolineales bacterium]